MRKYLDYRKRIFVIVIVMVTCGICILVTVGNSGSIKTGIRNVMGITGLEPIVMPILRQVGLASPALPERYVPNLPPDRISLRRFILADLRQAISQNDYKQAAYLNSMFAQEAFQRAYFGMKAWETLIDPETGLLPIATHPRMNFWNTKDVAADLFPFLLLAGEYLELENENVWVEALQSERNICGEMPCSIQLSSGNIIDEDLSTLIFGASEYAKDGLLAITERSGNGPWLERLEEVMGALIDAAYIETKRGELCDTSTEVNGEMLQVLSRLYWMTSNDLYLDMAERIAEAYLFDVLPKNQYIPTTNWDFIHGHPLSNDFRIRDHGSEIIPGLTELYLLEKLKGRPQAQEYREPLKQFLDAMLELPRTEDGLWYSVIDTETLEVIDQRPIDTWGYVLLGFQTFDLAEGSSTYSEEIERVMRAAASRKSFPWEGNSLDGYADAIESMLYLLPWYDISEFHYWVDDEIEVMFDKQSETGFIEEWYLDGNFIRTSLLYAQYKTQGVMPFPWRNDVRLGAAYDPDNRDLYLYLAVDVDWSGQLRFDLPRHATIWNMPYEYPRLNSTPEWFTVEPEKMYSVVNLETGDESILTGQQLAEGLEINLIGPRSLWIRVTRIN